MHVLNDPNDPGEKKITNSDEQEVVVNHSTKQEDGYDEPPISERDTNSSEASEARIERDSNDKVKPA